MGRFQQSVEINASADSCYQQWKRFEEFPQFMDHVKSVHRQGDGRWHWTVKGPLGKDLEWDAEIDGDEPGKLISWHTISEPTVGVQGAVRFDEVAPNVTKVTSTIQYEPPAGPIGEVIGAIFSNPQAMVDKDLENFKALMEGRVRSQVS